MIIVRNFVIFFFVRKCINLTVNIGLACKISLTLQKEIDFLRCIPYFTVVSPYLFIDECDIFHRKQEIFYESAYFYIWNIYELSPIGQKRYNIT